MKSHLFLLLSLLIATHIASASKTTSPSFKIYPAPQGIELSAAFSMTAEDQTVPVYKAKVPPAKPIPRLNGTQGAFEFASFASLDLAKPVTVTVTCPEPVRSAKILPTSFGIVPEIEGKTVTFTIREPQHLTLEVNNDWHDSLHIFANPIEEDIPKPSDPNVIYFGPGIHEVTSLTAKDNQTIYIAGGAVVRCVMAKDEQQIEMKDREGNPPSFILQGKNVTLRGRGIIEGGGIAERADRRYTVLIPDAENVLLEGVIIHDPSHWTVPIKRSSKVRVDNIKIIGRRGNADGVDISSSRDVLVENCFMRTLDDLVVVKSRTGQGEATDIHVRKCVLWNELAHALSIGAELRENVSRVRFEDCDIIHDVGRETALRIYHCDGAVISDITFENIRLEEARRLISVWIGKTRWTKTKERGHIRGVVFRNITATSAPGISIDSGFQDGTDWKPYVIGDHASMEIIGWDKDHLVEDLLFENVVLDGKKVTADQVTMNEFVKNLRFE